MKDKKAAELAGMNDAALVERAKNGDQAAYTALYESTAQETFRSIRSMVRTEEQALDIQQDAYVYAFTHLDTLGEPKKFRAWLRAIAVNRTRSVLRKQTPVLFSELESEEGEGLPELADTDPAASPELALERKETAAYLKEILGELTVGQRMLVGLYYYEQQSVGQIAEALEVTPGTVKTQLFRARKRIESAVKALEQRGVKLWGLSPLPFMLSLMKRSEPAAEASRTVLQGSLTQAGLGAETVAVHVGRGFFQTVLGRAVLGVAAAAALGGGVLAYGWARDRFALGDVQPPTETVLLLQTTEETRDADKDLTPIPTQIQDTEAPDTPEDLTEPDTTEPATEPEITEPTTEPKPLAPPELDNPGSGSSNPDTPITVSTEPKTTESELPGESSEAATEQSTELTITEASEAFSETTEPAAIPFGFYGAEIIDPVNHPVPVESNRIDTLKVGQLGRIMVMEYHLGEATPVYCEPSDILSVSLLDIGLKEIDPLTNQGNDLANLTRYDIRALKPGTVKIYCRCMNADMTRSSLIYIGTITVTEDSENNG